MFPSRDRIDLLGSLNQRFAPFLPLSDALPAASCEPIKLHRQLQRSRVVLDGKSLGATWRSLLDAYRGVFTRPRWKRFGQWVVGMALC